MPHDPHLLATLTTIAVIMVRAGTDPETALHAAGVACTDARMEWIFMQYYQGYTPATDGPAHERSERLLRMMGECLEDHMMSRTPKAPIEAVS